MDSNFRGGCFVYPMHKEYIPCHLSSDWYDWINFVMKLIALLFLFY